MKTNDQNRKIVLVVSITTLIFILFCASHHGYGQHKCDDHIKPGIAVSSYSSGNGLGTYYEALGSLQVHRSTFMAGPCFQKITKTFNGAKIWYSYSVTGVTQSCKKGGYNDELKTEVAFFTSVQYYSNARFSRATIRLEKEEMQNYYATRDVDNVGVAVGMNFNFKFSDHFKLRTYIAINHYHHLNFNERMFHDNSATVLMLGLGFGINK